MSIHSILRYAPLARIALLLTLILLAGVAAPAGAASIYLQGRARPVEGTIDKEASDENVVVIRTPNAVVKIPRAKVLRVEEAGAVAADGATSASQAEQSLLKRYESDLARDPGNQELLKKLEEIRKSIQSRQRLNYDAYFQRIDVLMGDKKYDDAIKEADGALVRVSDEGARTELRRLKGLAHIKLAGQLHDLVNYPEEEKNYRTAMTTDPENPVAPLKLADLLQQRSSSKGEALECYMKGIELATRHPGLLEPSVLLDYEYKLGDIYLGEKRYLEAADQYLGVMQTDKTMRFAQADDRVLDALSRLPRATLDAPSRAHMAESVKAILAHSPRKQGAFLMLGHLFFDQKDWSHARDNLKLAVDTANPTAADATIQDALFSLGVCQHRLHDNEGAIASLEKLIQIKADQYDALCELGEILLEQARPADARRLYEQARVVDDAKSRAYLGLGLALQHDGNYDDARKSFKTVLDRDKKNAVAQLAVARSYFEQKNYDSTIGEGDRVIAIVRDHYKLSDFQDQATSASATATRPTSATLTATPAPADKKPGGDEDAPLLAFITPEDRQLVAEASTLIGKSNVLANPPRTNVGRDNFTRALKFDPRYAPALEGIGMSWAFDKMNSMAEDNFQKAIDLDPKNPDFYFSYAAYWQNVVKNPEKALPLYLKYQELGGTDPQVVDRIKECGGKVPAAPAK